MDKLRIVGGRRLQGSLKISGAKNAALPMLFACLLTEEPVILHNIPRINDIHTTVKLLEHVGVTVDWNQEAGTMRLCAAGLTSHEAPYDLVRTMRASILMLGPLLVRCGQSRVSLPGGCAIGSRPVDQHIHILKKLGAEVKVEHGFVEAAAPSGLSGTTMSTDMVTVGGTEQLLMTAVFAKGTTVLENAAREPEVVDLANLLIAMGARIQGHGTAHLVIEGVECLHGCEYSVLPDRIEAGTFLCAVGATGGELLLEGARADHLHVVIEKLQEMGMEIESVPEGIRARMDRRPTAVNFRTSVHPGFPTDMQGQLMALNCLAEGTSVIQENIFENRFMHVPELCRMGAQISLNGNTATVQGVSPLSGADVMATDLRASASLIIAALAAEGESTISRIYHLDRGYDRIEEKLRSVGAQIERFKADRVG